MLDIGFLQRLGEAMETNVRMRTFVAHELGLDLIADLSGKGLQDYPIAIADALLAHETDPRRVGDPVGSGLKSYCATFLPAGLKVNGLVDMARELEQRGTILTSHRNL